MRFGDVTDDIIKRRSLPHESDNVLGRVLLRRLVSHFEKTWVQDKNWVWILKTNSCNGVHTGHREHTYLYMFSE